MHAIWSGSINFGLVNIPIKLYSAADDQGLDLTMLHKTDLSPIRYARVCRADGKEIPYKDIVKGYEYQKGDYIELTEKDFAKADSHASHTIDIVEFTNEQEIDVRFFEKPYYLEPAKGADKAYALLYEALHKSKKVAIAKFVLRNREHLAVLKPVGDALVLNMIRFASAIRDPKTLDLPDHKHITRQEIDMALALVNQLTKHFVADDFHDTYLEQLKKIIQAKISGKPTKPKSRVAKNVKIVNLMSALKASLEKTKAKTRHIRPKRAHRRAA